MRIELDISKDRRSEGKERRGRKDKRERGMRVETAVDKSEEGRGKR